MEIILVLILTILTISLFVSEVFPVDQVALLILVLLLLTGLITPLESISGFSNPAVITVAAMFVLSAGLQQTGAVRQIAHWIIFCCKNRTILLISIIITSGVMSAFINNTAVVAILLPVILALCADRNLYPSHLLIPLSYAAQFGGVCTLIGTSTNLLVSSISELHGYGAFSMFEFSSLGLIFLGSGTAYMLTVGQWLLPTRSNRQLLSSYELAEYLTELRVLKGSPLIGTTLKISAFGEKHDTAVLEIIRAGQTIWSPENEIIQVDDILLVRGNVKELIDLKQTAKLQIEPEFKLGDQNFTKDNLVLVEILVPRGSLLIGKTLPELFFSRRYNAIVLAIRRQASNIHTKLSNIHFQFGDTLLLLAPKEEIGVLERDRNFIVLDELKENIAKRAKAPLSWLVIIAVITLAGFGILPILTAALTGCLVLVIMRCLSMEELYRSIDWQVIMLLACILPLGIAIEKTGAAKLVVDFILLNLGSDNPLLILAVLYFIAAVLTEFITNNAAAVLLAPIAISIAASLNIDPKPFLMAICFAASTSFSTPIGYQTNTMVYNPGGYKFTDYLKVGIPLNILFLVLAVYFIPKFWSF